MSLNKEECPDFDDDNYEKILDWGKVTLEFDELKDRHGNVMYGYWTMVWEKGFIGFTGIRGQENLPTARMASAMFVYLWCHGIMASLASELAPLYVYHRNRS